MNAERRSLLQAIKDQPEDFDRYKIFADWLEENGEADLVDLEYKTLDSRGGMIWEYTGTCMQFCKAAKVLCQHPIQKVTLTDRQPTSFGWWGTGRSVLKRPSL